MLIITRPEARQRRLREYFTGLPCRNGHIEKRYTTSGTCAGCIRASSQKARVMPEYFNRLVEFKARVFAVDLELFSSMVYAAAAAREPNITRYDVWKGKQGSSRTAVTALHVFRCFPEDLPELQESARRLFDERAA